MARLKAPQRKEQLMAVATKIFARLGYNAATTHSIAEAAGVTEPILYRHFKSKQVLFAAITSQMSRQTIEHWQTLIAAKSDPVVQIRTIAREFPAHLTRLADAYHVIHGALAVSRDKDVVAMMKQHYKDIEKFFVAIIKRGKKSGAFRSDLDPRAPAWQIIHLGIGYAMISLNLTKFDHASVADAIEFILHGIRAKPPAKRASKK
jgi:AcrR family transcriptional regulator